MRTTNSGAESYPEVEEPGDQCPVCEGFGWVQRRVPVGHRDFGEVFQCRCRLLVADKDRLQRLQRYSGLPDEMLKRMTFDNFDPGGPGSRRSGTRTSEECLHRGVDLCQQP